MMTSSASSRCFGASCLLFSRPPQGGADIALQRGGDTMKRHVAAALLALALSSLPGQADPMAVDSETGRFHIQLPARAVEKEQATPAGKLHLMLARDGACEWTVSW